MGGTSFSGGDVSVGGKVNVSGDVVAPYFVGSGSRLTGVLTTLPASAAIDTLGNVTGTFASVSTITATSGNVGGTRFSGGNVSVSGQVNVLGNVVAPFFVGNVYGVQNIDIRGNVVGTYTELTGSVISPSAIIGNVYINSENIRLSGQITALGGNVVAPFFVGNGSRLTGVVASGVQNIDIRGNVIGSYANVSNVIATFGNVGSTIFSGGNVAVSGQVNVLGNIVAPYFIGTGSQITRTGLTVVVQPTAAPVAQIISNNTTFNQQILLLECTRPSSSGSAFDHIRARSDSSNVFRVIGNGTTFNVNGTFTTGADYAELFQWEDGNINQEDRRGKPVVLSGSKIRIASQTSDPYDIIGVVSTDPTIVGDTAWNEWSGMYLKDKYGQQLKTKKYYFLKVEPDTDEELIPCSEGDIPPPGYVSQIVEESILNPAYDPSKGYINRLDRSEWDPIGLCGKVRVDNSFVTANVVHPSWKPLKVIDDPDAPGNASAQVVEMLIGVAPSRADTSALQDRITSLENTVNMLKTALAV